MLRKNLIIGILVIAFAVLWLWHSRMLDRAKRLIDTDVFPLSPGTRGKEVRHLQRYLNKAFAAGISETGIYDTETTTAVRDHLKRDKGKVSFEAFAKWQLHKY